MPKRKRGLSKLDFLAIGSILILVAVFVVPHLWAVKINHNEKSAIQTLKVIRDRMIALKDKRSGPALDARVRVGTLITKDDGEVVLSDCHFPGDPRGDVEMQRHGFNFRIEYAPSGVGARSGYVILAWPKKGGDTGNHWFAANADGKLYRSQGVALSQTRRKTLVVPGPGWKEIEWDS